MKRNKSCRGFTASSVNFNCKLQVRNYSVAEMYIEARIFNEPRLHFGMRMTGISVLNTLMIFCRC